jgi:hypothetical protein
MGTWNTQVVLTFEYLATQNVVCGPVGMAAAENFSVMQTLRPTLVTDSKAAF